MEIIKRVSGEIKQFECFDCLTKEILIRFEFWAKFKSQLNLLYPKFLQLNSTF